MLATGGNRVHIFSRKEGKDLNDTVIIEILKRSGIQG